MERGLLLNIVVGQCAAVFKLLTSKNESLLVWRYPFLILNLLLHILDGIARLSVECDCFSSERLDKNLQFDLLLV